MERVECGQDIGNQVTYANLLQERTRELLDDFDRKDFDKDEVIKFKKQFRLLHTKSEQVLILLQVLAKLNKEVAHARLELEKAVKFNHDVHQAQKKFKWIEKRFRNFLLMSKSICHIHYDGETDKNYSKINPNEVVASFIDKLSNEQKQRLLLHEEVQEVGSADNYISLKEDAVKDIEQIFSLTSLVDEISSSDDEYQEEEEKGDEDFYEAVKKELSELEPALGSQNTVVSIASMTSSMVDNYWNSDHHRFEWTNFMQKLDPTSWHALAISYSDSFLKGSETFPSDKLPWRLDRDLSEGSAFSKKAIERLHERLKILFQEIVNASVNSVKLNEKSEPLPSPTSRRSKRSVRYNRQAKATKSESRSMNMLPYLSNTSFDYEDDGPSKLFSRPVSVILPVLKQDTDKRYPRNPKVWCDLSTVDIPKHSSYIRGTKSALKDVPTISNRRRKFTTNARSRESHLSLRTVAGKVAAMKKSGSKKEKTVLKHNSLKWNRVLYFLGNDGIQSKVQAIAIDAFKSLAQLGVTEKEAIQAIRKQVNIEDNDLVLCEASKCIITLGTWDSTAVKIVRKGLQYGERGLKLDLLDTIINARNAKFVKKEDTEIMKLIKILRHFAESDDEDLALKASLSLGHLCVADDAARDHLYTRLSDDSFAIRDKALSTLVRQMNRKDAGIIDAILFQLSNAKNWKQRVNAAELLQFMGGNVVTKDDPVKVFDSLEKLLWNHPNKEVRSKVAEVIDDFGMRPKAMFLVYKRLEDLDENTRSNAILMLSSLRMKGEKELKLLLDMVELDSSVNVRIQVLHLFDALRWNDTRVIRSLQEREKGEGILAREASNVIKSLKRTPEESFTER